jgi:hypothetical protein
VELLHRLIRAHPQHALALLLLVARLADVLSTRLVTPTLQLEANPLVRRLGWPFAWATLAVALVAYLPGGGPAIALAASVLSLFVAADNISRLTSVRVLGETEAQASARRIVASASSPVAYGSIFARAALLALVGSVLLALYPTPDEGAFWFAEGLLLYALVVGGYGVLAAWRVRRAAARAAADQL